MPKAYLQLLGTCTSDSSPSVLLFFDDKRYLFNAGEGSQRFCCEHGVKLSGIRSIFLTNLSWDRIGGLPGTVLTMADSGHQGVGLYGATGLRKLLSAMRPFMYREKFPLDIHEIGCIVGDQQQPIFLDSNLRIRAVTLSVGGVGGIKRKKPEDAGTLRPRIQSTICYSCELTPAQGKFNVAKAKQLGVPPGPLYGQLKAGHSVTLGDGTVVEPSDCVEAAPSQHRVLIIECPSPSHATLLSKSEVMAPDGGPCYIVHITPPDVLVSPEYSRWAASHGAAALHIVMNSEVCPNQIVFSSSSVNAQMLNQLSPQLFAAPLFRDVSEEPGIPGAARVVHGEPLACFHIRPPRLAGQIDRSCLIKRFEPETHTQAAKDLFKELGDKKGAKEPQRREGGLSSNGPHQVTCLGTGSMMPSKYRNVSGIHIQLDSQNGVVLDPGEGSAGQMARCFSDLDRIWKELSLIWVSHMHADHHLGIITVCDWCAGCCDSRSGD